MNNDREVKKAGLKEFVCGVLVLVFGMIGLARLADGMDSNISKHAVLTADNCGSNKNQACNQGGNANKGVRRSSQQPKQVG